MHYQHNSLKHCCWQVLDTYTASITVFLMSDKQIEKMRIKQDLLAIPKMVQDILGIPMTT